MSSDAVISESAGLSGANLMAVEHAELVVALYAAVTALDENGLHQEASAARAVLRRMAIRAVN
jgi:cobalamin biosynthesis protein CbiG